MTGTEAQPIAGVRPNRTRGHPGQTKALPRNRALLRIGAMIESLRRMALTMVSGLCSVMLAAAAEPTFAERLGWGPRDVVVILHVDDVGMCHSANQGGIESVERGVATSWSVMMPCPWVPEIAQYLRLHPEVDSGLHLTLTSEWRLYRWGPLAGKSQVPGLVDPEGSLWRGVAQVVAHATADEVDREIRAQFERAEQMGLPITHLDSHMGTLFARPDFFERYVRLGVEKQVPILRPAGPAAGSRRRRGRPVRRPGRRRIDNRRLCLPRGRGSRARGRGAPDERRHWHRAGRYQPVEAGRPSALRASMKRWREMPSNCSSTRNTYM
jgi:hypothetical protein